MADRRAVIAHWWNSLISSAEFTSLLLSQRRELLVFKSIQTNDIPCRCV